MYSVTDGIHIILNEVQTNKKQAEGACDRTDYEVQGVPLGLAVTLDCREERLRSSAAAFIRYG